MVYIRQSSRNFTCFALSSKQKLMTGLSSHSLICRHFEQKKYFCEIKISFAYEQIYKQFKVYFYGKKLKKNSCFIKKFPLIIEWLLYISLSGATSENKFCSPYLLQKLITPINNVIHIYYFLWHLSGGLPLRGEKQEISPTPPCLNWQTPKVDR